MIELGRSEEFILEMDRLASEEHSEKHNPKPIFDRSGQPEDTEHVFVDER